MTTLVVPLESFDDYIMLLKEHDWYYAYSDDHSVWNKGFREFHKLLELRNYYDPDSKVWNEHAPADEFKFGV